MKLEELPMHELMEKMQEVEPKYKQRCPICDKPYVVYLHPVSGIRACFVCWKAWSEIAYDLLQADRATKPLQAVQI